MSGVFVLTGPTAGGKSALAIELALYFDAEIVGADSRQIYRGMPIGTAAPTALQRATVRHHCIDFVDPYEEYSAARYVRDAAAAIADIRRRGKRALVVGGTGFYVRALSGDVGLAPERDPALRARLARELLIHDPATLHAWLRALDPQRAGDVEPGDPYRITRGLEIALARRSAPAAAPAPLPTLRASGIVVVKAYLDVAPDEIAARVAVRTDAMLAAGFVDEAERVGAAAAASDAVGYDDALAYLAGRATAAELRTLLARKTRRYAKRQATWFRTEPHLRRIASRAPADWIAAARETPGWA